MELLAENLGLVALAILLVFVNAFFVAAEFALVKVRPTKIDAFVLQKRAFAKLVRSQLQRLDAALSACQLGITLSSLGLGWIGEPALARLIRPVFDALGVTSPAVIHGVSFAVAFSLITALHLTIGEQVPKMYAVKNPEKVALWCALPLRIFYVCAYPFLMALNVCSNFMLRVFGVMDVNEHESAHSEEEIRGLLAQAHSQGELTRTEHKLLNAVFEFDDRVAREVMIPRKDIVIFEEGQTLDQYLQIIAETKHTRYPFCQRSLDDVLGIVHIKDLVGGYREESFDIHSILRPANKIPAGMEIGALLRHFQTSKQHMALVIDEFGNVIGVITAENVLEEIVGSLQDEFDEEAPRISPSGPNSYHVEGGVSVNKLSKSLRALIESDEAETISGAVTEKLGEVPEVGDKVTLGEVAAEVLEVEDGCAVKLKIKVQREEE